LLRILQSSDNDVHMDIQDTSWKASEVGKIGLGRGFAVGMRRLVQGEKWTETKFYHLDFDNIIQEELMAPVSWIVQDSATKRLVAIKLYKLKLQIVPASSQNLNRLCDRIGREILKSKSPENLRDLSKWIIRTTHKDLISSAFQLMEAMRTNYPDELLAFIDGCYSKPPTRVYVDYLMEKRPIAAGPIAWHLTGRWNDLSNVEWKMLREAPNPWVRGLVLLSCPARFDPLETQSILDALSRVKQPLDETAFGLLLERLKSDDFRIRERATNDLVQHGVTVTGGLKSLLSRPLDADLESRVRSALAKIERLEPDSLEVRAFDLISLKTTDISKRLLEALSHNMPESWIQKASRVELQKRK